jgi:uncharacterized membrane protein YdbT with pleckstrin-like domain
MPGEGVVYQANLHWIIFLRPAILLLMTLVFLVIRDTAALGGVFLVLAVWVGWSRFLLYRTSEFAVTNQRVLIKVGYFRKKTIELFLDKVEGITVNQGILGQTLGYGSLLIGGTGGSKEPFPNIANPLEFRRQVQGQVQQSR